jgi:hypothetical protein
LLIQLREYEREEQRKREQAAHGGHAQDRAGAPNKSILPSGWRRMPERGRCKKNATARVGNSSSA